MSAPFDGLPPQRDLTDRSVRAIEAVHVEHVAEATAVLVLRLQHAAPQQRPRHRPAAQKRRLEPAARLCMMISLHGDLTAIRIEQLRLAIMPYQSFCGCDNRPWQLASRAEAGRMQRA